MALRRQLRNTALQATALVGLVEVTTNLPSEGRSSLTYHRLFDQVITPLGRRIFGPEDAHNLAVEVVRRGWAPRFRSSGVESNVVDMTTRIRRRGNNDGGDLQFPGVLGLAAGFDKDGVAIPGLFNMGFVFVEIGSVTPLPQPGNPKPRSFRLTEDRGVINRFGFNSIGVEGVRRHLEEYRREFGGRQPAVPAAREDADDETSPGDEHSEKESTSIVSELIHNLVIMAAGALKRVATTPPKGGILGVNLGKNKTSDDEVADYKRGIRELGPYADYLVINVSSPNTPGLRGLQQREPLRNLLTAALVERNECAPHAPLFVKIAPDLSNDEMADVASVVAETEVDGMIVSNTTNTRPDSLLSKNRNEVGGLSGAPVRDRSTHCIHTMYRLTDGKVPIIGVGGVGSGRDAYDKIKAGASLVQIYSMMVYEGPGVVSRIRKELADLVVENGHRSVEDVVGIDHEDIYWRKAEGRLKKKTSSESSI